MIEINLLPEDLRVNVKAKNEQPAVKNGKVFNQDLLYIGALPAVIGIFILLHLFLGSAFIFKNSKLASLNRKWAQMEPQKIAFDEFNKEYSVSSGSADLAQAFAKLRKVWAQKLNQLSLDLPAGVWFNHISITNRSITVQGSVISLEKQEVSLINDLMANLKSDSGFSKDFSGFELSSIQKKQIQGYEVADFTFTGNLKGK